MSANKHSVATVPDPGMIVVPPDRLEMRGDRAHWDRIHPAGNRRHRPQR
jgi:hypothetical protein